jgi:hypothetical protein
VSLDIIFKYKNFIIFIILIIGEEATVSQEQYKSVDFSGATIEKDNAY